MPIRNKREFLARRLSRLGILRLLERFARRPGLLVLGYHRIGDPRSSPYYAPVFSATPEQFERQVRWVRDRYRIVDLDEVLAEAEGGFRFREPVVLITFDDGYRDNAERAFPILRDLRVPATFFLVTSFLDEPRLPWWDRIASVVNRSERRSLALEWPVDLTVDIDPGDRARAIGAIIRAYLDQPRLDEQGRWLEHLEERARVEREPPAEAGRVLFLGWDDARRMAAAGMTFGSHSHRHRNLATLAEPEQRDELATSRAVLERELGRPVEALAYPFGWPGAFTEATKRLAREAGYRLAFAAGPGVNRPGRSDALALARIAVGSADTWEMVRARTVLVSSWGRSPI